MHACMHGRMLDGWADGPAGVDKWVDSYLKKWREGRNNLMGGCASG